MMDWIMSINGAVNGFIWGPVMLVLLVGTGVYLSARVGFIQVRKFGFVWRHTLGTLFDKNIQKQDNGGIAPFQAVSTALAATVGTGNITGVATAIVTGGPGAVFWMWVSAFFGMVTKYSEIVLSIKYRQKNEKGEWVGGPMYYIQNGLNMKWLAMLFAFLAVFASFGIGNIAQANSVASAINTSFGVPAIVTGVILAIITALVTIGGIKRISAVTSMIIPFMSAFYIIAGLIILIMNIGAIPAALKYIVVCAFTPKAIFGGGVGYTMMLAMRYGFARGVFSNEAGLGSAPIAHAAANTRGPVWQGIWGIFEVFLDTIVICTITGLVVVISGLYQGGELKGADLAIAAFSNNLGSFGGDILSIALVLFAASTIFGWAYYGEKSLEYLCNKSAVLWFYKIAFCIIIVFGCLGDLTVVWDIADTLNGMMAIPNLIGLLLLSKVTISITKEFFSNKELR